MQANAASLFKSLKKNGPADGVTPLKVAAAKPVVRSYKSRMNSMLANYAKKRHLDVIHEENEHTQTVIDGV